MIYDLIEVKPKMNKKKVIIASGVVLIIILLFVVCGIKLIKLNKNNIENEQINNSIINQQAETIENVESIKNKTKHLARVNLLPIYTEEAKNRINNIYHSGEKVVYLTFDDGPSKTVTPLILDLLKRENIKATFFVLGYRAELNPDILRREYTEGHYIANHGYSHIYSSIYSSPEAVIDEYNKTQSVISNILGINYNGHLFRFPGGSTGGKYKTIKADAKKILNENQILYIDWNALSQDAAGAKTKEALIENIKNSVEDKNSVVILMHDAGDKILTYESLSEIITYLREQGYTFKNFYSIVK